LGQLGASSHLRRNGTVPSPSSNFSALLGQNHSNERAWLAYLQSLHIHTTNCTDEEVYTADSLLHLVMPAGVDYLIPLLC
jgi:hypothetical protein